MSDFNPYAAPKALHIKPPVQEEEDGDIWREKDYVVTVKNCVLPGGCIKCYATPVKLMKRSLFWHRPWLYFLLVFGVLPYLIAHVIAGYGTEIEVPLCRKHVWKRRRTILYAWLLIFPGSILPIMLTATLSVTPATQWQGLGGLAGVLITFVWVISAAVYGIIGSRIVAPHKMDKEFIWLKGAGKPYLDHLDYQPEILAATPE